MKKWIGVLGILLVLASLALIRIPEEGESGIIYSGMLVTERVLSYPVMVEIEDEYNGSIGVALENYELDFGLLSKGMVARKEIVLNSGENPVRVRVFSDGNISRLMEFDKTDFLLEEDPQKVTVKISADSAGYYSGNIHISSIIYNYRWLDWLNSVF